MICIKSNGLFCFVSDFYREWLAHLVGQIYLLTYSQILRAWKLLDLQFKDSIRGWLSVCFFRHQVDILHLSWFHICHCRVKALDHLACAAYEF